MAIVFKLYLVNDDGSKEFVSDHATFNEAIDAAEDGHSYSVEEYDGNTAVVLE